MENPNGYGCVKHLNGSQRNPFTFVVTDCGKPSRKSDTNLLLTAAHRNKKVSRISNDP